MNIYRVLILGASINRINEFAYNIHSDSELLLCVEIMAFQVIAWVFKNRRLRCIFKLDSSTFCPFYFASIHYYLAQKKRRAESLFMSLASICDKAVSRIARERIERRI